MELRVPEEVSEIISMELLLLAGMVQCRDPDEPTEYYVWTKEALRITDAFWKSFTERQLNA